MTEQVQENTKGPMPPYIAFKTLTDIVERMESEEPPTRVDPTYLDNYAGGYRPTVINNLQMMGLLEKTGQPTPELLALVAADEPTRKRLMGELVRRNYADVLALPKNSTQGEFLEVFSARGASGDTRRKAISFFLKACTYAGEPVGNLWKTPPASTTGRRRSTTTTKTDPPDEVTPPADTNTTGGEVVTVNLGEAGTVVLSVNVKWLKLDDATFSALRTAIKDISALASDNAGMVDTVMVEHIVAKPVDEPEDDEEDESSGDE